MTENDLDKKLDLILHHQRRLSILGQLLLGWVGLIGGYIIGVVAPTMFVINISNVVVVVSGSLFIISLIRFIRVSRPR